MFWLDFIEMNTGSSEIPGLLSGLCKSLEAGELVPVSIKGFGLINSFRCA